ncbi:MAG: exodeoxyribonuclease III [Rickettsiales bacterium]|jgi:exodeoxyribonuclease III|nr:exodeoxyribonuclease III [Rickettsiales bacterium]
MQIIAWNVNSVNSRLNHLVKLLKEDKPDVVLLQELKCLSEKFPFSEIEELGYNVEAVYQKSYNGVAILSKHPIDDVNYSMPNNEADEQARYIDCLICCDKPFRVSSVYVPNGQEVGSDKYQYKLGFYEKLTALYQTYLDQGEDLVIGGDFNVANLDIDVYDVAASEGKICFEINERKKLRQFINLGLYDSFRLLYPEKKQFTWWDYRGSGFTYDKGLRIDYIFTSCKIADRIKDSKVLTDFRALEKPSDHAPLALILEA